MRHLATLLCAALLGCATSAPVTIKPASKADPAVDIDALLARDGLIAFDEAEAEQSMGSGRKALLSSGYYELDGAGPPELIIYTNEYTGEGTWSETLWVYEVSGAPRALAAAPLRALHTAPRVHGGLTWGSYMDQGWWRAGDLDGDGRAEIVIMGHTDGVAPSPLAVLGWGRDAGGEGVIDKLWRDPGGVEVVAADVDGDGRRELVSIIAPRPGVEEPPRLVGLKPDAAGRWREVALDVDAALPVVLDALIDGHPRVYHALPLVVALMRARKLAPRDVKALQQKIEARLAGQSAEDGALHVDLRWHAEAMAWPGNVRAYDVLLPYLGQPYAMSSMSSVADALLELDAQTGQGRGRAALIGWLKGALADDAGPDDRVSLAIEIGALLQRLDARGIEEGARLVAAWLADLSAPHDMREVLLTQAMSSLSGQLELLAPLWADGDDALAAQVVSAILAEVAPYMRRPERWRAALKPELVRGWMARAALFESAAQLALYMGDAGLREAVWAGLDKEGAAEVRASLMYGAREAEAPLPERARLLRWQARATDVDRDALWAWAMDAGSPALLLTLLEAARTGPELQRAIDALYVPEEPCDGPLGVPGGCVGMRGRLLGALPELHKIMAARLASRDQELRAAALAVMTLMPYEPTQRLLIDVARAPGEPLAAVARGALTILGHPSAQDYLFEEASRGAESDVFAALGRAMDAGGAQRLVDWLAGYMNNGVAADQARRELVFSWALWALAVAAPGVCAPQRSLLESLVDDAGHTCDARAAAATALALCDPSWLTQRSADARSEVCEGELLLSPLNHLAERGVAAHLPALERLAEDPRARLIREQAHRAAVRIKARGAPKP